MSDSTSNNDNKLTGHDYDGIQELDNQLPRWWLMLFYLSIAFAVGYFAYYEIGNGQSIDDEFASDVAALEAQKAAAAPQGGFPDEQKLLAIYKDPGKVASGGAVFAGKCFTCHGEKGQGGIGPNLTDSHWLHGDGKLPAIAKTIHDGVSDKGMPPWNGMLSDDEIYAVASYVKSLKGTNPANAKAPQGTEFKE